jgi:hypothetical protein
MGPVREGNGHGDWLIIAITGPIIGVVPSVAITGPILSIAISGPFGNGHGAWLFVAIVGTLGVVPAVAITGPIRNSAIIPILVCAWHEGAC